MIDWLKRDPREEPAVEIGEQSLPIVVRRHPTAKRLTLRLGPDGRDVRVSIPRWARTADAIAFARSRHEWLATQIEQLPKAEPVRDGATIQFRGAPVIIRHLPDLPRKPHLKNEIIALGGPEASLRSRLKRWLESEARAIIATELAEYCAAAGKSPPRLALSNAQRRWGSCGPDGAIRINWRLVMAPDQVRRSVVAHEVAHLVHFNHSPQFHALLGDLFEGDIRVANGWLKREGRSLYLPFG